MVPETVNPPNVQSAPPPGYQDALKDLRTRFDKLSNSALDQSAGIWRRYGVAGGSLVFGGAVAILALTATMIAWSGWKPEDLITCMGFAVLLILIGTVTQLIDTNLKDRRFDAQVRLYGQYQEGVTAVGRDILAALEKGRPNPPNEGLDGGFRTS